MNRFFFFGCSYTHFAWPTWADLLGASASGYSISEGHTSPGQDPPTTYNFGYSGGSNSNIINRILIADQQFKFDSKDTICVQWTSKFRHTVAETILDHRRVNYSDPLHSIAHCYWQEVYAHRLLAQLTQSSGATVYDFDFMDAEITQLVEQHEISDVTVAISDKARDDTQLMQHMLTHDSDRIGWNELAQTGGFDRESDAWWNKTQHVDAHPSPHEHLCVARSVHHALGLGEIRPNAVQHAQDATDMLHYLWDKCSVEPSSCDSDSWQTITQTVRKSHVAEVHSSNSLNMDIHTEPDAHSVHTLLRKP